MIGLELETREQQSAYEANYGVPRMLKQILRDSSKTSLLTKINIFNR